MPIRSILAITALAFGLNAGITNAEPRDIRVPAAQRGQLEAIDNWREHHLSAPPRGQHGVQLGADYVLAAIATGTIRQIVVGN